MGMTQAQFMREFNEKYREEFNPKFFERSNEEIIESIYQILKSCERDKYFTLKLLSFTPIYDYQEIYNTLREHEEKRKRKNDKTENFYDFINIRDTAMILIKVEWLVRHNGIERVEDKLTKKITEVVNPQEILEVLIAVPRFVRKYYFRLSGNYYSTTFQIVDGSTYNNSTANNSKVDSVTDKTMFHPIRIFRGFRELKDIISGESIKLVEYQSILFNNIVNCTYYILANYGLCGATEFLEIPGVLISEMPCTYNDYVCFEKHGIYISCPKYIFQDHMVQTFIASIYDGINKDATINDLFDQKYWIKNLGAAFKNASIGKGLFVLDSVDGIYDNITKRDIHLPDEEKENIYFILRWMMREFSNLRVKDNLDVRIKRIRLSDYITQAYVQKINKGMHRISDMGSRVTLKKVIQAIYTAPMFLITQVSNLNNLIDYRDMVNDLDSTVALKWTYKGISGLGEDGAAIQPIYRYIDPSYAGILDPDASSNSDPGMSGMICPMANIEPDNSFSKYEEPNTWREQFAPIRDRYYKGTIKPIRFINNDNEFIKMSAREKIVQEELDINKIICPIKSVNGDYNFTCSQQQINEIEKEKPKSLFNISDSPTTILIDNFDDDDY